MGELLLKNKESALKKVVEEENNVKIEIEEINKVKEIAENKKNEHSKEFSKLLIQTDINMFDFKIDSLKTEKKKTFLRN